MKNKIRIGCGAGFSGDRLEPAEILTDKGNLDYLVLECLAERTIALAQKRKQLNPELGYDTFLERRMRKLLPTLSKNKICLITNMGAANPLAAAQKVKDISLELGLDIKVGAVFGDDVLSMLDFEALAMETNLPVKQSGEIISANAYLGVDGILKALENGSQIIITGRVADPSLFLAPMIHEFGWKLDDYDILGQGTVIGHLLECAGQITGGYFADKDKKSVPGLDILGHPIAEISNDGSAIISKVEGTGGLINLATVKEQLLYEVINPNHYITPDVEANFTTVKLEDLGQNQVLVKGGTGKSKPVNLKVSVGFKAFYLGEGEISYAGFGAEDRARLGGEIIEKRLSSSFKEIRIDYIGISAVHRTSFGHNNSPYEIRLRVAAKADTVEEAAIIGEEVEALYTNGPAGGGGVRKIQTEVIGVVSVLMERNKIKDQIAYF
ncbi:acyclic terpene utilization AtuA family protein [Lacihabitans sp. CS3-21]|uniref:acyclic terpene utilization AtuA family protein n=1 Tax=Lacihabitans sp. CS3-21 TaxID=2487332 RepID=UPI0020CD6BDF|nr:acyclic terpene utilization AtuA family protein [Lacihabitans sp. CS3-21]MCP9746786.1 DUF1446 domain-containing protein [Lacihabitans sp. CS3-21]